MRTVKNEQYNIYIGISIEWFEGVNPHSMDQSRKRGNRDTANSTTTRRHPPRHPDTQTARHRRRLVVNGWSVHAPQHIRFGTLEVCLQNAPGSLPSRSGLLRPREIGMQGGLTREA